MEFWPTDFRADNSFSSRKRRSGKEAYSLVGQTLDVGSLGAATLITKDNSLEWKTLVQPPGENFPRQIEGSIEILPPNRPSHLVLRQVSAPRKAVQEVHFLRTNYPDIDIPLDLIQEIQAYDDEARAFDPYQGNVVAQLAFLHKNQRILDFIAFPVGETGSELNVSPVRETINAPSLNFTHVSKPLIRFETPIRQLETFPRLNITENYSLLAVRTYGSVSMLKIEKNKGDSFDHPLDTEILYAFSPTETGERQVIDMSCGGPGHTDGQTLLANDAGGVFLSRLEGALNIVASPPKGGDTNTLNRFWRVGWSDVHTYIRASEKEVHLLDLRTPGIVSTNLFHLTDPRESITSLDSMHESPQLGFSTTSRLLLFDVRNMRHPVISLNHHRSFDRSLRLKSFRMNDTIWHSLSSSRNRLVTVYSTTSPSFGLPHLQGLHSILPSSLNIEPPIIGSHIFQKSANQSDPFISYLQLSSTGSMWSTDITFLPGAEQDLEGRRFLNSVKNEDEEELLEKSKTMPSHFTEEDVMESTEADLSAVYRKITQVRGKEEEKPENFYRVLDKLPSFWQDTDVPVDHMLTTFDIAFRSGLEPEKKSRSDFLTGNALNAPRGSAALLNDRLPIPQLLGATPWSFDLASLSAELVPDSAVPPQQLLDRLTGEAVSQETTTDGIKYAVEAARELVLDLGLSRHVYAPHKFSNIQPESNADNLWTATQALSLDSPTIPAAQFSYLQPVSKENFKEGEDKPEKAFDLLPGVGLLLSEWKVGTKPEDYRFSDWYRSHEHDEPPVVVDHFNISQPQSSQVPRVVVGRPPPIVASAPSVPRIHTRRSSPAFPPRSLTPIKEINGGSQMDIRMTQSSLFEEQYANTQPLPGPFGGQLDLNKRKKAVKVKKRMGGF